MIANLQDMHKACQNGYTKIEIPLLIILQWLISRFMLSLIYFLSIRMVRMVKPYPCYVLRLDRLRPRHPKGRPLKDEPSI